MTSNKTVMTRPAELASFNVAHSDDAIMHLLHNALACGSCIIATSCIIASSSCVHIKRLNLSWACYNYYLTYACARKRGNARLVGGAGHKKLLQLLCSQCEVIGLQQSRTVQKFHSDYFSYCILTAIQWLHQRWPLQRRIFSP